MTSDYSIERRTLGEGETVLALKGRWAGEMAGEIRREDFDQIEIWPGEWGGFEEFEAVSHHVRSLRTVGVQQPLKGLEIFSKLENLSYSIDGAPKRPVFRPSAFPELRRLSGSWHKSFADDLPSCKSLKVLSLDGYSEPDCQLFGDLPQLESLNFGGGRLESLDGIQAIRALKQLNVIRLRKLSDISAISSATELRQLWIENAKNVMNLPAVQTLENLSVLYLVNCGALSGLDWIERCQELRSLWVPEVTYSVNWRVLFSLPHIAKIAVSPDAASAVSSEAVSEIAHSFGRTITDLVIAGTKKAPMYKVMLDEGLKQPTNSEQLCGP